MPERTHVPPAGILPVHAAPLPNPLGGARRFYEWRGHRVAYVVRGEPHPANTPLLFVHAIHAAAWSAEWRHVFAPLSDGEGVGPAYAIDLLGFGASDRPPLRYTAQLYIDLLRDFTHDVIGRAPVAYGSSLGATYLFALEADAPGTLAEIVAVGPAGISRLFQEGGAVNHAVEALFRSTVPGTALFRALVSRPSIRFFLKDTYAKPETLTPEAMELFWLSANHPNARFAPAAFVGLQLSHDIRDAVKTITCPIHLIWGTKAAQTPFREATEVRAAIPQAHFTAVDAAGDLPHEEAPAEFLRATLAAVPALP